MDNTEGTGVRIDQRPGRRPAAELSEETREEFGVPLEGPGISDIDYVDVPRIDHFDAVGDYLRIGLKTPAAGTAGDPAGFDAVDHLWDLSAELPPLGSRHPEAPSEGPGEGRDFREFIQAQF